MRQLVAGNWKMHGLGRDLADLEVLKNGLGRKAPPEVLVCPPASLIARAKEVVQGRFALGAQDCHPDACGAFTGDISAEMLKDAGASWVIVGHSERRLQHDESDDLIARKARATWRAGIAAIICLGETESERDKGIANQICRNQIEGSVPDDARAAATAIAYEPVWAIGSGRTPTLEEIAAMHRHIRACLSAHLGGEGEKMRILYGGSVNPANARAILALECVDGALVGGASLKPEDFLAIIDAARPP